MKLFFYFMFLFLLYFSNFTIAQEIIPDELQDNMDDYEVIIPGEEKRAEFNGGLYVPSEGIFKILVIFVKMQDDNSTRSDGWPLNSTPDWLFYFVDNDTNTTGQFNHNNVSQYFYEMSNGTYQVIGDVDPNVYISQHPESYYNNLGQLNNEILTTLDNSINYSLYDNWTRNGNYSHTNQSDGKVDMIMIIYRELSSRMFSSTGYAAIDLPQDIVTNDGVIIKRGFPGSGLEQKAAIWGFDYTKYISSHEFGHYLFGGGHLGVVPNLSLMHGNGYAWNASRGMCSWERERLNWIDYTEVNSAADSVIITLNDFLTTDNVVKINTGYTGEYFLLENRQCLSFHDYAKDKGLYIYHITNGHYSMATIDGECADGNWNFNYNSQEDTLIRDIPYYNGKDELNYKYTPLSGAYYKLCIKPHYWEDAAWGDAEDAFNFNFYPIFSPWSNPRNTNYGNKSFSLKVNSEENGIIQAVINFSNPLAHPPSKPLDFEISWLDDHPHLTWSANSEPDLLNYEIWKKTAGFHNLYATTTNTFYTDVNEDTVDNQYTRTIAYMIRAADNTGKKSIFTKEITVEVKKKLPSFPKITEPDLSDQETTFNLFANYPNPFNPITKISYSLPEKCDVVLEIYNVLGQKVSVSAFPVNETGIHYFNFDGSTLPSGFYFYRINAKSVESNNKYTAIKRMLLIE